MNDLTQYFTSLALSASALDATHISAILDLQKIVYDDLAQDEKAYIVPKDFGKLTHHFNSGGTGFGLHNGAQMIAQGLIYMPQAPDAKNGVMVMPPSSEKTKSSVIQGLLVHPHFRGNKLAHTLVQIWKDYMTTLDKPHVLAEVATENIQSWAVFLDHGLSISCHVYDPDDEVDLYILHGNLHQPIKPCTPMHLVNMHDLDTIKSLLADGHVGHAWQKGPVPHIGFSPAERVGYGL